MIGYLHLSPNDLSALLIEFVTGPARVELPQACSDPVVLPEPDRVHREQAELG